MSTKSFKAKHGLVLRPQTLPLDPENGQLACDIADGKFKKYENGAWSEIGSGNGGGGGVGTLDTIFTQTFETATLADFTQTGLVLSTTEADLINGLVTAKMTHDASVERSFMQTIELAPKYRGVNLCMSLFIRSTASDGNVTVVITDVTNMTTLTTEVMSLVSDPHGNENVISFDVPETCEVLSYEVKALTESGSPVTYVDDISIYLTKSEIVQSVLEQEADQYLRLDTANGYGSTANKVRRYSSVRRSIGDGAFIYQDSPVNGVSITITKSGVFSFSMKESSAGGNFIAITRNLPTSDLTTAPLTLSNDPTKTEFLVATTGQTSTTPTRHSVAWTGYLEIGDIIRPMTEGITPEDNDSSYFDVAYQGQLKQVNVNPASKITIPTSELRMEGSASRGSVATSIVRFDAVSILRGGAFTVESDASLGTRITMKRAGKVSVSSTLQLTAINTVQAITVNQSNLTSTPTASESKAADIVHVASGICCAAAEFNVKVGDVIRIFAGTSPVSSLYNSLNISFQEQEISVSVTNTQPKFSEADSSVRVDTANGYGSTATKIRRFSNVRDNLGTDIEYTDSATNGASFTIKEDGIYSISYTELQSGGCILGITLNSVNLTTNVDTLAQNSNNEVLAINSAGQLFQTIAWTGFLSKDSVIRPHTTGGTALDNDTCKFTISKVGKPNITAVDVTPFVTIPQPTVQSIESLSTTTTYGSTNTGVPVLTITKNTGSGIIAVESTAVDGTSFRVLKKCTINISATGAAGGGNAEIFITRNSTVLTTAAPTGVLAKAVGQTAFRINVSTEVQAEVGDVFRIQRDGVLSSVQAVEVTAEALSDQILTEPETFNSDTAPFVYAPSSTYTLSTLANAPVGTFITFTYAASGSVRTQTTTAPTQTTSDMNTNGIQVFTRAYNATSTAAQPACVAIQIGKGHKGLNLGLYKSTGKQTSGELDCVYPFDGGTRREGFEMKSYNASTGILVLDAGYTAQPALVTALFTFSDATTQNNGYVVINASKNPALTGLGVTQKVVASYYTASALSGSTTVPWNFDTKLNDNYNAVTTGANWRFTAPRAGFYNVSGFVWTNGSVTAALYINGTQVPGTLGASLTGGSYMAIGSMTVYLQKDQYLDVRPTAGTGSTATTLPSASRINIVEV